MLSPKFLTLGQTIGIVSTARYIEPEIIEKAVQVIQKFGFRVKLGQYLHHQNHQFAGTDLERAQDLTQMWTDPEVSAIWCARGGYGTIRLIPYLDLESLKHHPKWIVGYSDVTVLHALLSSQMQWQSIHATMPVNLPSYQLTDLPLTSVFDRLVGRPLNYRIPSNSLNKIGVAQGELLGGNLSILYSLRGTLADIDTQNKILFIEDLDEYLYHIDRMIMNLKIGGKLAGLKGLVVGGMTQMHDNQTPFGQTAEEIILEAVKDYNFPVVFGFPAGHITDNYALPFGQEIMLSVQSDYTELKGLK